MATILPQPPGHVLLDDREMARVENAIVHTSLSPASARAIRIERIIASQPNLVEQARMRGFYDHIAGAPSQARAQGKKLEVSYEQGWARGARLRAVLDGRPWYEVEKLRDSGKWVWRIYREGFFQAQGSAPNERRADQDIEVTKADLMDKYGDWRRQAATSPVEETVDEDMPGPRM